MWVRSLSHGFTQRMLKSRRISKYVRIVRLGVSDSSWTSTLLQPPCEVGRWLMKYTTQAPLPDAAAANSLSIDDFGALQQAQETCRPGARKEIHAGMRANVLSSSTYQRTTIRCGGTPARSIPVFTYSNMGRRSPMSQPLSIYGKGRVKRTSG